MTTIVPQGAFLDAVMSGRGKPDKPDKEAPAREPWTPTSDMPAAIPRLLPLLKPKMNGRLPDGMAELLVLRTGGGKSFTLRGAYGDKQVEELGRAGKPELDLNSLAIHLTDTVTILADLASWSREKTELADWLNRSRSDAEREASELELVIWDDTGFRIPWELFWLVDAETFRRPNFLGVLMTVTRWLTTKRSNIVQDFTMMPGPASGPVVAFVHENPEPDQESMAFDKELLRTFEVDYAHDMPDVLAKLRERSDALGLVYVACHGEFGDGPEQCKLGGLSLERAGVLADYGLFRLHNRQTLVFLNACASGPVGEDRRRYNDGALRGFPKLFLQAGAAGVLATAAPIKNNFAHQAAGDLLERLRHAPDLPVATALRDLRRNAAKGLPDDIWTYATARQQQAANEMLSPVLYWCLYLYYGSPRMALSIASANASPADN
jgi:CHAT domain